MFHVYYNFGSCNYGDHGCGLESFATLEEALARAGELARLALVCECEDSQPVIIEGREVPQ